MKVTLALITLAISSLSNAQIKSKMKLNAGIITDKIEETKSFYTEILDFGVRFENDFYLLLHTPNKSEDISFLKPHYPSQKEIFQRPFQEFEFIPEASFQ